MYFSCFSARGVSLPCRSWRLVQRLNACIPRTLHSSCLRRLHIPPIHPPFCPSAAATTTSGCRVSWNGRRQTMPAWRAACSGWRQRQQRLGRRAQLGMGMCALRCCASPPPARARQAGAHVFKWGRVGRPGRACCAMGGLLCRLWRALHLHFQAGENKHAPSNNADPPALRHPGNQERDITHARLLAAAPRLGCLSVRRRGIEVQEVRGGFELFWGGGLFTGEWLACLPAVLQGTGSMLPLCSAAAAAACLTWPQVLVAPAVAAVD